MSLNLVFNSNKNGVIIPSAYSVFYRSSFRAGTILIKVDTPVHRRRFGSILASTHRRRWHPSSSLLPSVMTGT